MKKTIATIALAAGVIAGPAAGLAQAGTPEENTAAMQEFTSTVGVGTTIGTITGTAVGFALGCIAGTIPTIPTVILVPAGCLAGGAVGATAGGAIGLVLGGGTTGLVAGQKMVQILLTPSPIQ